ncbi:ATP-dependent DNA helicase RecG [Candidatus Peregrinibacteria bacterium]|nr:ATP-dependent DNA helicase RecG [Candidatus Peregrinibacteria bacterium]
MKKIPLSTSLSSVLRTTERHVKLLKEIEIQTVADLLTYFPREYEDQTHITHISEIRGDQKNVLRGRFSMVRREQTRNRMILVKAVFTDEDGNSLECVWFNQPYLHTMIPAGKLVTVVGKAKLSFGKISLQSPTFEEVSEETVHTGRIVPIYPEHGKLNTSWFRTKIFPLLDTIEPFPNLLPEDVIHEQNFLEKHEAILEMHFPTSMEKLENAKKTLAFEELFLLQLASLDRKKKWKESAEGKARKIPLDPELQKQFFATLPFVPTNSQKIAIFEILKDLEKPVPMLRLLEGDVGSGKTLVAISAAIAVISQGYQVAIMAPTEILAEQHYEKITETLSLFPFPRTGEAGIRKQELGMRNQESGEEKDTVFSRSRPSSGDPNEGHQRRGDSCLTQSLQTALLTGSIKGKKRAEILENLRKGKIDLIMGTHALIEETVEFRNLGLVIIDEQHRFGVRQREKLVRHGSPHLLQMTATPIPRTLAIVAFGDQDLSVLTEMPPGRKPIHTKVVPPQGRRQIELFVEQEVKKGHQAFVICPLVSESEKIEAKAAEEEFIRLKKDIFPHLKLALVHGRMKPKEKDQVMENFKNKKFDILISTSVIEVGIDIPNANIILIEGAERFGLAQLHQFRGRVGRSEMQSYCFLFPTDQPTERIKAMEKIYDGFKLAEIDLKLRGPGEVFGLKQSGIPDLKMASFSDGRLVVRARQEAEKFLEEKRGFSAFPLIEREVERMNAEVLGGG